MRNRRKFIHNSAGLVAGSLAIPSFFHKPKDLWESITKSISTMKELAPSK